MTSESSKGAAQAASAPYLGGSVEPGRSRDSFGGWSEFAPKSVSFEDAMSERDSQAIWNKLYQEARLRTPTEDERKMFRASLYVYAAVNGTSREGDYAGTIVMANGHEFQASIIPLSCGKLRIRKFFRTNMAEAYDFFKSSRSMEAVPRYVSRAAAYGVSADCAFAMADFLDECPKFTPAEARAHGIVFNHSVDRARRARSGKSLEAVESQRLGDVLRANGHEASDGQVVEW